MINYIKQSILNLKSTLKHKVLYIIYYSVNTIKELLYRCIKINIMYRYLSAIILLIKKNLIRWGMNPIFYFKSMSDNVHYVNLMPKQLKSYSQVGDYPSFAELLRKITRVGGILGGSITRLSKNTKTLMNTNFGEKNKKRVLNIGSRLCKLGVKYA